MTTVHEALRGFLEWREPRPLDGMGDGPFRLACSLDPPASDDEIRSAWPDRELPAELMELWSTSRQARLFEDIDYGQWGLTILSPEASAERSTRERNERPADITSDDIVIAEFVGDSELLVFAPSEGGMRRILVALPLDDRSDWYGAADSLGGFLESYLSNTGEKYWEIHNEQ